LVCLARNRSGFGGRCLDEISRVRWGESIAPTGAAAGVGGALAGEFGLLRIGEAMGAGIVLEDSSKDQSTLWVVLERTGEGRTTAYSSGEAS
jgi:hypothetical protein